jgi:hypothetical protein
MFIITDQQSLESKLSAQLVTAIEAVSEAFWTMRSMTAYDDSANGITDADWLGQIVELLAELDPKTRSPRCPKCNGSQLIFCEEIRMHYRLTDAEPEEWRFGGAGETVETGRWYIECETCGHELRTASEHRGFNLRILCESVLMS